ncbi:hypothetical protein K144313037_00340 [Clostridium tetani]|uniref:hypothetical protein n=1 Tax=Clostridium tetani TaxID=1513 RepID=UPI0002EB5CDD|nr:hypothetical protein [Clostridium tetani]KGI36456.1 hypothetical protein LA33_13810 [Clostridium tetani ATCC 9441]KGI37230.1 hypothetical protein KY52_11515 [Clostridium tetani]KGI41974.1 hypothetical protein KY54_13815 [Clostridium tetani]KHO38854.1 hypothetical protein OR63_00035 [Clostridium tetani]KIG19734.1 hypothetical protein RS78_13305 [Clostridium tetani]
MRIEELKMIVAENCDSYSPFMSEIISKYGGTLTESCENCKYFIEERCIRNLFDPIKEIISRN